MSWIQSVTEAFSSLFCRSPEAQVLKTELKHKNKSDKEFWDNRFRNIFAKAKLNELLLMNALVESNNEPQEVNFDIDFEQKVKIDGIEEYLYQKVGEEENKENCWSYKSYLSPLVRITVPVFEEFKKQFNKYGKQRIPNEIKVGNKDNE